ncbi:MAG: stage 0 sporulation family protein [Eubacterium sp.]|nr:stage 0 sporulation family protein [Eubacterium sp.]
MVDVIGVRFRQAGKIYFFDPVDNKVTLGDHVIVETARGVEYGRVVVPNRKMADDEVVQPLKPVMRIATAQDDEKVEKNKEREKEAFKICKEKIRKHELEMKLVEAEYTFDNNKLLFYFTADGRIDFRELVKDLASVFRTRIELRQIGVRDETKIMGGLGICGRPMCCHTYLSDFAPVSIKMAKEQNLSLNPTKISGTCGRLMCCLRNEQETYEYLNKQLPNIGDRVLTPTGEKGEVTQINVLRQLVKIVVEHDDEKEILEYPVADLKFKTRRKKKNQEEEPQEQEPACEEQKPTTKEANKNSKNKQNKNKNKNKNRHKNKEKQKMTAEEKELKKLEEKDGGSKLD